MICDMSAVPIAGTEATILIGARLHYLISCVSWDAFVDIAGSGYPKSLRFL